MPSVFRWLYSPAEPAYIPCCTERLVASLVNYEQRLIEVNILFFLQQGHTEPTSYIPERRFRLITLFIVIFSLCVALVIPSVELIIGLVGSTIGVAICIMFPAISFRKIIKKESTERALAQFVFVSGFCLMILGTYANLNAIDAQSSGPQFDAVQMVTPLVPNDKPPLSAKLELKNSEILKNLIKEPNEGAGNDILNNIKNLPASKVEVVKPAEKPVIVSASSDNPPMPPLPVDESHSVDVKDELKQADSVAKEEVKEAPQKIEKKQENLVVGKLEELAVPTIMPAKPKSPPVLKAAAQQTIDHAAIKKEEEITAEEQKDNKAGADELRESQKELKEKMQILERTVDELNEELAKQKPQDENTMKLLERSVDKLSVQLASQNPDNPKPLVVDGLAEALNKIKETNRQEEQLKNVEQPPQVKEPHTKPLPLPQPQPKEAVNVVKDRRPVSLMEMLTENAHARDEQEAHAGVFEPLSYKTGEKQTNGTANAPSLAQRLPLPLVLLGNVSRTKTNSTLVADLAANKSTNSENVEAIRRELLQVKEPQMTTAAPVARVKRDADGKENCLPEPKLNVVPGAAALSMQIENMGRELKSVTDENEQTSTTTRSTTPTTTTTTRTTTKMTRDES